jgi:hypothetical protein
MKRTKEWLAKEKELKSEALLLLALSEVLKDKADDDYKRVMRLTEDTEDEKFQSLPWDEKEKIYATAEILDKRLQNSQEALKLLDKDYEVLRKKVNEFYGKELMKSCPMPSMEEKDEKDPSDWWKN